jgi:hypothetical protein
LLSFAQFEREVTGERIRDKIAGSKKRGMWMGGLPPLGYDVADRKLVANDREAETVRHIYRRYAVLGSVLALKDELDRDEIKSKVRIDRFGRKTGGKLLSRGALYLMLHNRIYYGEIVHKDKSYPGEHQAIIEEELWQEVQRRLAANRFDRVTGIKAAQPSLLAGFIYDNVGERMTPTHANKKGTRYRYYVSRGLVQGTRRNAPSGRRVPASDIERLVEDRLRQFLESEAAVFTAVESPSREPSDYVDLVASAADFARRWPELDPAEKRAILTTFVERIDLKRETLDIRVRPGRLPSVLAGEIDTRDCEQPKADSKRVITLTVHAQLKRGPSARRF